MAKALHISIFSVTLMLIQFCCADDKIFIRHDFSAHKTKDGMYLSWKLTNLDKNITLIRVDDVAFNLSLRGRQDSNSFVFNFGGFAGSKDHVASPRFAKVAGGSSGGKVTSLVSYCHILLEGTKEIGNIDGIEVGDVIKIFCSTDILVLGEKEFRKVTVDNSYQVELSSKGEFVFVPQNQKIIENRPEKPE